MITPTMHYGKIAGGRLDHEMQLAFLEAQTMGEHHGVGTTVTLEIKIVPKTEGIFPITGGYHA